MAELLEVWTPSAIIAAIVAGIGVGFGVIGPITTNPRYGSGQATATDYGRLVAVMAAIALTAFYVGQVVGAVVSHDELWWRILSRFGLSLVYSAFLGVGTWLAIVVDTARRRRRAQERARREFGK